MSDPNNTDTISFDLPKNQSSVIKVIGVGGGGSNAVNHMYNQGIKGVDFVVCNTDSQALSTSPVPNKVQLGVTLTEGLGAGANPEVGQQAALESIEDLQKLLKTNTKMVFITAGMGGGTGTGAAPVIAKTAKDAGILTVGICTIPFAFEGISRKGQAEKGVEALRNSVDSLIVINNNKLREVYGNLGYKTGFAKADEVLATAARGIAEVITHHYSTNIDLRDAKTVLSDSGTAIMGSATASGDNRASKSIEKALDSPLLNDNHIRGAKNVLLLIVSGSEEITIDEIGEINDHIQVQAGGSANIIMGIGEDNDLGNAVAVTIVATGFTPDQQVQAIGQSPQRVIHTLEDDQPISAQVYNKPVVPETEKNAEDFINRELAKLEQIQSQPQQANLFEETNNVPDEPTSNTSHSPTEVTPTAVETTENSEPESEIKRYVLEDENEKQATPFTLDSNATVGDISPVSSENETSSNTTLETEEPVFEISSFEQPVEAPIETAKVFSPEEEMATEEPTPIASLPETEIPAPVSEAKEEKIIYTLEDIQELEETLRNAKPDGPIAEAKPKHVPEPEDASLRFEIKSESNNTPPATPSSERSFDPTEMSLSDSKALHLKASERKQTLKMFNYNFKNQSNSIDEISNQPAYKRNGVKLNQGGPISEEPLSRFTIDDSEGGADIKTNNTFLHDNVD